MCGSQQQVSFLQKMNFDNLLSSPQLVPQGGSIATVVPPVSVIVEPRQLDVLCGKSKRCVDHDGSRRFRSVIECHRERYQQALTKFDKTSVTRNIYDALCQAGSRFLKHNETLDVWEEISPMAARDKIGHALRFANRVARRKQASNKGAVDLQEDSKPAAVAQPLQLPLQVGQQHQQLPIQSLTMPAIAQSASLPSSFAPLCSASTAAANPQPPTQLLPKLAIAAVGAPVATPSSAPLVTILPSPFATLSQDIAPSGPQLQPPTTTKLAPAASLKTDGSTTTTNQFVVVAPTVALSMNGLIASTPSTSPVAVLPASFAPLSRDAPKDTTAPSTSTTKLALSPVSSSSSWKTEDASIMVPGATKPSNLKKEEPATTAEPSAKAEEAKLAPPSPLTTLQESLFLHNNAILAGKSNSSEDRVTEEELFASLEHADWDFDAEILSILF